MLTTKRRIEKESDRFGGYAAEITRSPLVSEYDKLYTDIPTDARGLDENISITNAVPPPPPVPEPVEQDAPAAQAQAQAAVPPPPPMPDPVEPVKHEREDILPTVKTRAYATAARTERAEQADIERELPEPARSRRPAMDTRTKILVCVYVAIAVALAVAVIATGVSISGVNSQADVIAEQISAKQQIVSAQVAEIEQLLDEDTIRARADQNGMVPAGEPAFTVDAATEAQYPAAKPRTNGFDKFCDWLSGILA